MFGNVCYAPPVGLVKQGITVHRTDVFLWETRIGGFVNSYEV